MVDTLLDVVQKNNDICHEYYHIKAKLLGQKSLQYHERGVPIIQTEEPSYSFKQGVKIIKKVFAELDPYFSQVFEDFLTQGKIDVFPQKGKRGGAYNI